MAQVNDQNSLSPIISFHEILFNGHYITNKQNPQKNERNYRSYLKNKGELAERVLVKKRHRTTLTVLPVLLLQSEAGPKTETVIFYFKSQGKAGIKGKKGKAN